MAYFSNDRIKSWFWLFGVEGPAARVHCITYMEIPFQMLFAHQVTLKDFFGLQSICVQLLHRRFSSLGGHARV